MDDSLDSVFNQNVTLNQVINFLNLTGVNMTNNSEVSEVHLFDLYEAYRSKEKHQLLMYKWIAYVLGTLIIISNLTVVISSGLILRKGQQHKSTYLLLGNVSLADTIIGISIIFGASVDHTLGSNQLCIFQLGMLVCPAIVSIFSVGFIAVDRYIYILHGLYYQRWFNTTRVRIGILCIWMIGISLGFLPATGWVNQELIHSSRCQYVTVYPGALLLFNSLLSTVPIVIVTILYPIILFQALKNLRNIRLTEKSVKANLTNLESIDKPKLRINRGTTKTTNSSPNIKSLAKNDAEFKRSASFSMNMNDSNNSLQSTNLSPRSKSTDDFNISTSTIQSNQAYLNKMETNNSVGQESNFSIYTIESSSSKDNSVVDSERATKGSNCDLKSRIKRPCKNKGPNRWRAVTVVMLTSISFVITWMPLFTMVIFFVFCEEKLTNPKCVKIRLLLIGPVAGLAFLNSVLNPLIYAWWHKGFNKAIRSYFRKYCERKFFKR